MPGSPPKASTHSPVSSASTARAVCFATALAFIVAFCKNVSPFSSGSHTMFSSSRLTTSNFPFNTSDISLILCLLLLAISSFMFSLCVIFVVSNARCFLGESVNLVALPLVFVGLRQNIRCGHFLTKAKCALCQNVWDARQFPQ